MDFVAIISGNLKEGKRTEFVEWLEKNEARFAELHPEGVEYIGTYFAVQSSERQMGGVFSLLRMDSYGAQDNMAAATGEFAELLGELVDHFDNSNDAASGSILLKRATDATLWGSDI